MKKGFLHTVAWLVSITKDGQNHRFPEATPTLHKKNIYKYICVQLQTEVTH
jgi:hypothetical protein